MFSAPSSLSPLEELFGISNTDFPQNEGANCLDSVYSNDLDFTNVNRQTPPEPTTTLKDITRDDENMSNSERNGEQMSDSRNDALSIIPAPPPAPPPPPKLFGPNTSQNEQLLEKTGRAINLSPLRNNTSPNMEHLEKKLDLLQGMILKLMESVSQEKSGQYLSPSTASYQIPTPKVKKNAKRSKEGTQSVELLDAREKMMEELKAKLQKRGEQYEHASLNST
ncbi:hypothetical protein GAYE_SCF08G3093 [Galdieria yellowstonensis]|uniref:Uncharacterized protein n=1 Tax=Galdieria yellowstonensis TaxID=3028027 RepID=A0AAV9ICU8_9RHOD|nr:hypothetical protein GAYE_SCF08G3093 [Galdieria yellowstonensis]